METKKTVVIFVQERRLQAGIAACFGVRSEPNDVPEGGRVIASMTKGEEFETVRFERLRPEQVTAWKATIRYARALVNGNYDKMGSYEKYVL